MATKSQTFFKGDIIFQEGEASREAFILMKGALEVLKGEEVVAEITEEGSFIGEMAVLLGEPRSATLRAKEDCELGIVTEKNFDTLVQKMPTVAYKLAKSLAFRLRETTNEVTMLRKQLSTVDPGQLQVPETEPSPLQPDPAGSIDDGLSALLSEAQDFYECGDHMKAISTWMKCKDMADDPEQQYMIQNNLGCAYLAMGEFKKAMLNLASTLKLKPGGEEILCNFALIYLKTNNKEKAIELYEKVLKINPDNPLAKENLEQLK